jgi:hypothetical protein
MPAPTTNTSVSKSAVSLVCGTAGFRSLHHTGVPVRKLRLRVSARSDIFGSLALLQNLRQVFAGAIKPQPQRSEPAKPKRKAQKSA